MPGPHLLASPPAPWHLAVSPVSHPGWKDAARLFAEALGSSGDDLAASEDPPLAPGSEGVTLPLIRSEPLRKPERIGPYRVLEEIGSGGMGIVYLAEQQEPVRRTVALKLVKLGLDTREVIARFESERQALALMNHPHIARVFDAGTTPEGRPYFAMEYVSGIPITEYCDKHLLPIAERLRLFLGVCDGVQHAHHKGIIHRDLKPTNILVTLEDGRPSPRIIDFGIAKAVAQRLTDKTVHTEYGRIMGTPAYMSPEQAELTGLDIDTRTDVYSLGVLLYELLVGAPPFDAEKLHSSGVDDMRRQIREVDPPRPSTRLLPETDATTAWAKSRHTDAPALRRAVKGDLDWITMKALEKNRTRRYGSPAELQADIERHLRDEAVLAGPPSARYRLGKFIRRHRVAVTAAAFMLLALLVGSTLATLGLVRARRAEERAVAEANASRAINEFLQEILRSSDPERGMGRNVTVAEALLRARERIAERFADQPELEAEVRHTLGTTHLHLAAFEEAEELLRSSLDIRRRLHGEEHEAVAESLNELARMHHFLGNLEEAESLFRQVLAINRRLHGDDHGAVAMNLNNLAMLLHDRGELAEAEELFREALALKLQLYGEVHQEVTPTLNNLGLLLTAKGDLDDAERFLERALEANRRLYGDEHTLVATNLNNLASLYVDREEYRRAEETFRRAVALKRKANGDQHPSTAISLLGLGTALEKQDDTEGAMELYARALDVFRATLDPSHWRLAYSRSLYGRCLARLGRYEEAAQELDAGLAALAAELGDDNPRTQMALRSLVDLYTAWGREEEAEPYRRRLLG